MYRNIIYIFGLKLGTVNYFLRNKGSQGYYRLYYSLVEILSKPPYPFFFLLNSTAIISDIYKLLKEKFCNLNYKLFKKIKHLYNANKSPWIANFVQLFSLLLCHLTSFFINTVSALFHLKHVHFWHLGASFVAKNVLYLTLYFF